MVVMKCVSCGTRLLAFKATAARRRAAKATPPFPISALRQCSRGLESSSITCTHLRWAARKAPAHKMA